MKTKVRKIKFEEVKLTNKQKQNIKKHREEIKNIAKGKGDRALFIVGPCSAWSERATLEFARRLSKLQKQYESIKFVMRVYTQKPRTALGWKGLLLQPDPCKKPNLKAGVRRAQKLMSDIVDLDLAIADEALFLPLTVYLQEFYSFAAVGARSSEDQEHRLFAGVANFPVGIKNPTDGNLEKLANSLLSASGESLWYAEGKVFESEGNDALFAVLRGGKRPNYFAGDVEYMAEQMQKLGLPPAVLVDTNHSNSDKNPDKQIKIINYLLQKRKKSKKLKSSLKGFMTEAFLEKGNQPIDCTGKIKEGLSITDPSSSWSDVEDMAQLIDKLW